LLENSFSGRMVRDKIIKSKFKDIPIIWLLTSELRARFCRGINPSIEDYDLESMNSLSSEFLYNYKNSLFTDPIVPELPFGSNPKVLSNLCHEIYSTTY